MILSPMKLRTTAHRTWWPDCPNHPGHFKRAEVVNKKLWIYCAGHGWHAPKKWWE